MIWVFLIFPFITMFLLFNSYGIEIGEWTWGLFPLCILIIFISKYFYTAAVIHDVEFWGGWVIHADYFEDWNEYIPRMCTRSVPCGTDSKGNITYCTETYDCSYVQYHPEEWRISGSNGENISITKQNYLQLVKKWKNENFINLHHHYYTKNGNEYSTQWPHDKETLEPLCVQHSWENRVQNSSSIFNFKKVDPSKYGLFEYPPINENYKQSVILGDTSTTTLKAETDLRYWNAILGAKKKLRTYILVFKNKPLEAALEQQSYWKNGNKNEFIVTFGINNNKEIQWCYIFSWTDQEQLKIQVHDLGTSMEKLDLEYFVERMIPLLEHQFIKKNFHVFDYIQIDLPEWLLLTVGTIISFLCGVFFYIERRNHEEY